MGSGWILFDSAHAEHTAPGISVPRSKRKPMLCAVIVIMALFRNRQPKRLNVVGARTSIDVGRSDRTRH